jgi:parvulin-like peptidyl-prolyl isomerase
MTAYRNLSSAAALLAATFALSACGSGASRHGTTASGSATAPSLATPRTPDPGVEPNAVVASVGGHAITKAMYEHALADRGAALNFLIVQQWVIGGAAEEGVHVSDRELKQELKSVLRGQSQAQAEKELAKTGLTWADFVLERKEQLLAEGIRHLLRRKTAHPTQAQIASYYDHNKKLFGVPKRRDLQIVRAASEAEARKLKSEIAAGRSFASVASKLPAAHQPYFSKEGSVLGYEPGLYSEPPLDHAIFAAKPNVLSGPVGISLGYYVFEVKRTHPPQQKTLAQVQAAIKQQLPEILYKRALAAFVRGWRHRWRARTDCRPGYVVTKCRQYRPVGVPAPNEDPYTLN